MNRLQRAINAFRGIEVKRPELPINIQSLGQRAERPSLSKYTAQVTEGVYKNDAVQGCLIALTTTLNECPIVVKTKAGDLIPKHPLEKLFDRPNPYMSQSQFWKYVASYVYTGGNCYIHKVRNIFGNVIELYPYHDGLMTPVSSATEWVDSYNYQLKGQLINVPARDVVHIKWQVDPLNPIKSMSPIELAATKIQTHNELDLTIYSIMKNNGVVGSIMKLPMITPQIQESIREQWESFIGTGRGRLMITGKDTDYQKIAQNMEELSAESTFGALGAAICGIYRVHPLVAMQFASSSIATYSNMDTAHKEFTTLTRVPVWNDWADQLSHGFREELGSMAVLEFDKTNVEALKSDPDAVIYPVIAQFNANLVTQNEARERMGYLPTPDGDQFSFEVIPAAPGFFDGSDDAVTLAGEYDGKKWNIPEQKAIAAWKRVDDVTTKHATQFDPFVKDMYDDALTMATSVKAANADKINIEQLVQKFMNATGALRQKMLQEIIALAVADIKGDLASVLSFVDEIERATVREVNDKMTKTARTMKEQINKVIADNQGKPVTDITKALTEQVKSLSEGRSKVIAQTTAAAQTSRTQQSTWSGMNRREQDPKKRIKKIWITQRDSKVRDSHEKLDGLPVDVDNKFATGIEAPGLADNPGDAVNCRCIIRAVRASQV